MKLIVYGDSFTEGAGTRIVSGTSKFKMPNPENYPFWTEYLQERFGAEKNINRGLSGQGNDVLLGRLLADMSLIEEGDIIVFQHPYAGRAYLPLDPQFSPELFDISTPAHVLTDRLFTWNGPKSDLKNAITPDYHQEWLVKQGYVWQDIVRTDFEYKFRVRATHDMHFKSFYNAITFHPLTYLEQTKNIKFIQCNDFEILGKFETITTATNGEVEDYHLSWKGNYLFGQFLYKKFKEKYG